MLALSPQFADSGICNIAHFAVAYWDSRRATGVVPMIERRLLLPTPTRLSIDHAALEKLAALFSAAGRPAKTFSNAFQAITFSITAVIDPRIAGTRYTFSNL
jgi:hypothetical protein